MQLQFPRNKHTSCQVISQASIIEGTHEFKSISIITHGILFLRNYGVVEHLCHAVYKAGVP